MQNKYRHLLTAILLLCIGLQGCKETAIVDVNLPIDNRSWSYANKVRIPVIIEDPDKAYNLFFNLRHTAEYKYSNIFVLIHQSATGYETKTERREFKLAYPDGEWLGSGAGNFYSYQLLFREAYKFPAKGTYIIEIEQNMRDNPLPEITDVGLRVEPVEEK